MKIFEKLVVPNIIKLCLALQVCCVGVCAQKINPANNLLFDPNVVARVDVVLSPDSLEWLLDYENLESDQLLHATFVYTHEETKDTLYDVGFRLRGNTSRYADKKSFKISFNTYVNGRQFHGVEKLNLNGEHNDPSISRAKTCWDLATEINAPSSRTSHVKLYVNNEYFGVYLNVEHIDKEFVQKRFGNKKGNLYKCLYPADLNYIGSNPDLYKFKAGNRRVYDLKTNTDEDDYSDLAEFIEVLNLKNAENLPCALEKVFDVDAYLQIIAFDILTGNWDGPLYNKNNFYLYHDQNSGQFKYIPYDLDNTLGIDWFNINWAERFIYNWANNGENRPLYTKIMAVPEYRDRFSYYMQEMLQIVYKLEDFEIYFDNLKNLLASHVASDLKYALDYGFSFQDFLQSFSNDLNYNHVQNNLNDFVEQRKAFAEAQLILNDISPIIKNVQTIYSASLDQLTIQAQVIDDQAIQEVLCCYQSPTVNWTCEEMILNEGIFTFQFSPNDSDQIDYYIEAKDNIDQISNFPYCSFKTIQTKATDIKLVINEIMASNESTIQDEFGEYDDWVEIYNYGDAPINLGGLYISDNPENPDKWALPSIILDADSYQLIWVDDDPEQGDLHADFKLSAAGEFIGLFTELSEQFIQIDGTHFPSLSQDISYGRLPNGLGNFTELVPTPSAINLFVGTQDLNFELVEIYPNPCQESLNISAETPFKANTTIALYNPSGQMVLEIDAPTNQSRVNLDVSFLQEGLYFGAIRQNGQWLNGFKILKML